MPTDGVTDIFEFLERLERWAQFLFTLQVGRDDVRAAFSQVRDITDPAQEAETHDGYLLLAEVC